MATAVFESLMKETAVALIIFLKRSHFRTGLVEPGGREAHLDLISFKKRGSVAM